MTSLVASIAQSIRELVEVRETNLGIEATLPVAYQGGELVEVIIEKNANDFTVHDSGFGFMRVTRSGLPATKAIIEKCKSLAAQFDCSFSNSRVTKLTTAENLAVSIALVANASRSVADQALEPRRHSEQEFRRQVIERVKDLAGERVREYQELRGASGRTYRISVLVLNRALSKPAHFVGALATRSVVPNYFAEFADLGSAFPEVANEAIYDDASDFREEDKALLRRVAVPIALAQSKALLRDIFADEKARH